MTEIPADRYRDEAFKLGLKYLVTARFGAASLLLPVSGNLFHHAVEMFLKGCLVTKVGFDGLPRGRGGKDGHNLNDLWTSFTQHFKEPSLQRFAPVVEALHRFERIRYPEKLIVEGGMMTIDFASEGSGTRADPHDLPEYQVTVDDIDALVAAFFDTSGVEPKAFSYILGQEHARTYFEYRNEHSLLSESIE